MRRHHSLASRDYGALIGWLVVRTGSENLLLITHTGAQIGFWWSRRPNSRENGTPKAPRELRLDRRLDRRIEGRVELCQQGPLMVCVINQNRFRESVIPIRGLSVPWKSVRSEGAAVTCLERGDVPGERGCGSLWLVILPNGG